MRSHRAPPHQSKQVIFEGNKSFSPQSLLQAKLPLQPMDQPILVISGTNLPDSLSAVLAHYYVDMLRKKSIPAQILDLSQLPVGFLEGRSLTHPEQGAAFKQLKLQIEKTKKYVFIVPDYNASFPGILKMFIDQLSFPKTFAGKKCALIGLSKGHRGGSFALSHLTDIFHHFRMHVYPLNLTFSRITDSQLATILSKPHYHLLLINPLNIYTIATEMLLSRGQNRYINLYKDLKTEETMFNLIDVILVILLIWGAYRGFSKGCIAEIFSLAAIFLASIWSPKLIGYLTNFLKQFHGNLELVAPYIAFIATFLSIVVAITLLGKLASYLIGMTIFGVVDRILGMVLGIFKWAFMISTVLWLAELFHFYIPSKHPHNTWLFSIIKSVTPYFLECLSSWFPILQTWLEKIKETATTMAIAYSRKFNTFDNHSFGLLLRKQVKSYDIMELPITQEHGFSYIEKGEGRTLLLLHGLFGALSNWESVITHFSSHYRVIIPLIPIYEMPKKSAHLEGLLDFVHRFVQAKKLTTFTLIGNSLGGHIGLLYALAYPSQVENLVLTGSSGLYEHHPGGSYIRRSNYDYIAERVRYTFYHPQVVSQAYIDEVFDIVQDTRKVLCIASIAKSAQRQNLADQLPKIQARTLLIWGLNDTITPPFVAHEFNALIPNSQLCFFDHCSHVPMMEYPAMFNDTLEKFLESTIEIITYMANHQYTESNIRSLDWREHIRLRPGMYIGKLGDGSTQDDGIYVLLKEIIDNSIDEYVMGYGKHIEIQLTDTQVSVRDFGRGIPLGKVVDCVSKINTGGKYDNQAFQKSVGLNGVGTKAVNALSNQFVVQSFREGKTKIATFSQGKLVAESPIQDTSEKDGTYFSFHPDPSLFGNFTFNVHFVDEQLWNYAYLNAGLKIYLNGQEYFSKNGLLDLLSRQTDEETLRYPIIYLKDADISMALTHNNQYGETYYSFVNGQFTTQGGTHLTAFKEALVKTVRDFYKKDFDSTDVRSAMVGALSIRIQEPVFESQTKTKLGSQQMGPDGPTLRTFINDFIKRELDNYLHKNPATAEALLSRILQSERERKDIAGIKKLANERAKKANLHNKKLRDCRIHYNTTHKDREKSVIFITEGNSASGSITKSRDVQTQAVFSLRGKPLNCFGYTKKLVYENEELNLLQHALNIEEGIEGLRYGKIIIATDADVDGMHIRLLLLTYFLHFFPELVQKGHVCILETPLFRVRNKQKTLYCYSEEEKRQAIQQLGKQPEITRFKGLGEISADEFKHFIGAQMRITPIVFSKETSVSQLLNFYMGKNTQSRQDFIIDHLKVEKDLTTTNDLTALAIEAPSSLL
eukprot:gene583-728_t